MLSALCGLLRAHMDFVRKYIINDWKLKGLSVVLAVILWFAISHMGESKLSVSVPILPANLEKDSMIKSMDTEDVLVMINGPVSALKNLRPKDIKVPLDLGELKNGRHIVNIQKTDIVVPRGIEVEAVKPGYVVIEIERTLEKRLKTIVKLDNKWKALYSVKSWYPQYVIIEGSKVSIEKIEAIDTVPIDGNFMAAEEELDVALDTKGLLVRKVRPETIRVIIRRH
jgi:YbbR domain-containing protein